jgi:hypothetical protein
LAFLARAPSAQVASWRAHDGGVTCLEAVDGGACLLSASADRTLALWDVRRATSAAAAASGHHPAPLALFIGHKARRRRRRLRCAALLAAHGGCSCALTGDCSCFRAAPAFRGASQDPVVAVAVHGGDALSAAGGRLAVAPLRGGGGAGGGVALRPGRLTHSRGAKEKALVGALALLPHARLLLVGAEDGTLRACV